MGKIIGLIVEAETVEAKTVEAETVEAEEQELAPAPKPSTKKKSEK